MRRSLPYDSTPDGPNPQEGAALDWLVRLDRGLTPEEETEFERWLAANPQHGEAFGEFDGTWSLLNRVREISATPGTIPGSVPDSDAFAPRRKVWPRMLAWSAPLLAAAAVAVGIYMSHQAAPRTVAATEYTVVVENDATGPRKVNLPDGSTVQLNRESSIEVRFTTEERRVRLSRGEAHFTVARDVARAFVVRASAVDVQAVGTAFNVRLQADAIEVLVTEGKVRVNDESGRSLLPSGASAGANSYSESSAAANTRALVAGEKVTITLVAQAIAVPQPATPTSVAAGEIERSLAWQTRQLAFVSAPLADIVAEFNRHNRQQLVISDANLGAERFGGTFRSDDVAGFVRLLETHYGIKAERSDDSITLRAAR